MDMMDNRKKPKGRRGKGSRKAPKKTTRGKAAKRARTSRGIVTQYLPFRAHTYGKNLPEWAKKLGYAGDTIPVVTYPTMAKAGVYGLPSVGRILNKPRGKAKAKVSKIVRLESQMGKAVAALTQAITAGATAEKIEGLRAKLVKLQELIVAERVFEAKVQAAIAGATPAQIRKQMRAAMKGAAKDVGMTEKQAAAAPVVQVAAAAPVTPAARAAAVDVAFRDTPAGQEMIRGSLFGAPALSPLEARRRAERMMQRNPDVYGYAKGGKKKVLLDMVPATRGTPGAVTVVVSPHAFRYATLVEKALKKNGLYSVRKNMSKKRRMHKNPLGSDLMALGRPVLGATAGFAASRAVNALALYGLSKTKMDLSANGAQVGIRAAATAVGVVGTLILGDKVGLIRDNRTSIVTGMILNVIDNAVRTFAGESALSPGANPYLRNLALGMSYADVSHAGAPYSPMMGEYVSQSLNGDMGSYIAQAAAGMGEYVSQSLNGGDGLGEYVSQSLNGLGEYAEGVDPSDQEGVDGMISNAEAVAGLSGTEVMAATAGLGMTEVMAATAGLGNVQGMNRGIVTRRGIYNFFTQPVMSGRANIPAVSIEDAPMPVVGMGPARPGAVPIGDQVSTPEGRGYAGGIFGRHIFGTMV